MNDYWEPNPDYDPDGNWPPEEIPPEPEIPILLTPSEAEAIVNGLRGFVHHQRNEDPEIAAETPYPDDDPMPSEMASAADKVQMGMMEALGWGWS